MILVWAGFILLTVKKLWRTSNDPRQARFYRELKVFGVLMTGVVAVGSPINIDLPKLAYWPEFVFWAIAGFPVMMWSMYVALKLVYAFSD